MRIDFRRVVSDFAVGYASAAVILTTQEIAKKTFAKMVEMAWGAPGEGITRAFGIAFGNTISTRSITYKISEHQAVFVSGLCTLFIGSTRNIETLNIPLASVVSGIVVGILGVVSQVGWIGRAMHAFRRGWCGY